MKVLLNYSNLNAFIGCFELLSSTQQENKSLKWDGYTHSISMSSCIITYQRWSPELTGKFSYVKTEFKRNVITKKYLPAYDGWVSKRDTLGIFMKSRCSEKIMEFVICQAMTFSSQVKSICKNTIHQLHWTTRWNRDSAKFFKIIKMYYSCRVTETYTM